MSFSTCVLFLLIHMQLIEIWETFLLQMDADDDEPLGRNLPVTDSDQTIQTSHPTEDEPTSQQPLAPATATDLALEQDA